MMYFPTSGTTRHGWLKTHSVGHQRVRLAELSGYKAFLEISTCFAHFPQNISDIYSRNSINRARHLISIGWKNCPKLIQRIESPSSLSSSPPPNLLQYLRLKHHWSSILSFLLGFLDTLKHIKRILRVSRRSLANQRTHPLQEVKFLQYSSLFSLLFFIFSYIIVLQLL